MTQTPLKVTDELKVKVGPWTVSNSDGASDSCHMVAQAYILVMLSLVFAFDVVGWLDSVCMEMVS